MTDLNFDNKKGEYDLLENRLAKETIALLRKTSIINF